MKIRKGFVSNSSSSSFIIKSINGKIIERKPMNPLEIRAKYLEDILTDIIYENKSISYENAILILKKELGRETVEFGIENDKIPSSQEQFEFLRKEVFLLID